VVASELFGGKLLYPALPFQQAMSMAVRSRGHDLMLFLSTCRDEKFVVVSVTDFIVLLL
jgi:hypothetical protein